MKKTKLFAALLLLSATSMCAYAENFDTQILRAKLPSYVDISAEAEIQEQNINPQTGNLESCFSSVFTVKANDKLNLYLHAKTNTNSGYDNAFFQKGENVYVILSNIDHKPNSSSIADIKTGSATPENNPNAIAYPVMGVVLGGATTTETKYNSAKNQYEFSVNPGITTATTTVSPSVDSSTYSYNDRAGTYEAYVTLTDTTT